MEPIMVSAGLKDKVRSCAWGLVILVQELKLRSSVFRVLRFAHRSVQGQQDQTSSSEGIRTRICNTKTSLQSLLKCSLNLNLNHRGLNGLNRVLMLYYSIKRGPWGILRLMDKILHDRKNPKLWELWYIPYNG